MSKIQLSKLVEKLNKENTPPNGWPADKPWTEEEAGKAMEAAGSGLSRDDFCDDGADLQDLIDIVEQG